MAPMSVRAYNSQTPLAVLYQSIECERSLYLFGKYSSKVRAFTLRLLRHRYFERLIMIMIFANTLKLAVETYYLDDPLPIFEQIDYLFTVVFTFEAMIKILVMGFCMDPGSYLRYPDNCVDLLIVAVSIADNCLTDSNSQSLKQLKVLRLLRTLRPLRIVTHS